MLTVQQVAERYGVRPHTVLAWIKCGDLAALNVGMKRGSRPSWRVSEKAIDDFETVRTTVPKEKPVRKPKQRFADVDPLKYA